MLDFTEKIKLNNKSRRTYLMLRVFVYFVSLVIAASFAIVVMFPTQVLEFDFNNPNANKNKIYNVDGSRGEDIKKGVIPEKINLYFDAFILENFSQVRVNLMMDEKSNNLEQGKIRVRKTYKAFSFPVSKKKAPFKDGNLLKRQNSYYIVSEGLLRKFPSSIALSNLEIDTSFFTEISEEEFLNSEVGEPLENSSDYPENMLFVIENAFYKLKNGVFTPFVSREAYLTNYRTNQALEKPREFLENFQISKEFLGFSDGSMISFGDSVYIVENNEIHPIDSAETITSMGLSWDDVIPVSEEEIGIYEKEDRFTLESPHPNGTIFLTENEEYFLVKNNEMFKIVGDNILKDYLTKTPVIIEEASLAEYEKCDMERKLSLFNRKYSCSISILNFEKNPGNNFQFILDSNPEIQVDILSVYFEREISWKNFRLFLVDIKNKIIRSYVGE